MRRVLLVAIACAACGHAAGQVALAPVRGPRLLPSPPIDPAARGAPYLTAVALQLQPGWRPVPRRLPAAAAGEAPAEPLDLAATATLASMRTGRSSTSGSTARATPTSTARCATRSRDASPLPRAAARAVVRRRSACTCAGCSRATGGKRGPRPRASSTSTCRWRDAVAQSARRRRPRARRAAHPARARGRARAARRPSA